MHASTLHGVLEHLRKLTDPSRAKELSDADLLERFRLRREEAAFTLLVQRHGTMVLNVCRRVLGDAHEAEDTFQATFLVLVRKAATIRKEASLSSWLHVVATHLAHKARAQSARRRACEREIIPPARNEDSFEALAAAELRSALDEEIERLPAKYRIPLVLCCLADKTHEQAARELGWPKSSVTARLAKARQLLQQRLIRRGFTASAGLLAMLLTEQTVRATVPCLLTLSTVHLAVQALTGETLAATTAAVLANTFAKGSVVSKWAAALALLATMGLAAIIGPRIVAVGPPSKREEPAPKVQAAGDPRSPKAEARKPRLDLQGDPLPDEVVARMGSGRLRHAGFRHSLSFSPDGKYLVSATRNSLRLWDAVTGKLLRRDETAAAWYTGFTFTREGIAVVIVESGEGIVTVRLIDPATGAIRRRVRIKEPTTSAVPALSLSPNGKRIAFAHDNTVRLYDTARGEKILTIPVKGSAAWDIAFAPDGKILAFTDQTDTIYVHDAASGKLVRECKKGGDRITLVRFSPNGRFLLSIPENMAPANGEVSVWDLSDGKECYRWHHPFPHAFSAAFAPDGKQVAITARAAMVLWDLETGKELRRFSAHGGIDTAAFSPDGKTLAAESSMGVIRLWDATTGKVRPISADPAVHDVHQLRFRPDGKRLFGCAAACLVWDPANGRELRRISSGASNDFPCLLLSPDESLLATANRDGTIHLRDAATGKEARTLKGHERWIWDMVFSPDGRRLISNGWDETIRVWDVASGRELRRMRGGAPLAVSPDGRWLASAIRPAPVVLVWDLSTGQEKKRFALPQQPQIVQLAFSADSRLLAAVGGTGRSNESGAIKVWSVADGQLLHSIDGHKWNAVSVAFSPDSRMLATGGMDNSLTLWELASGRRRHSFVGHESRTYSLAFSPHGRMLAASSIDAPVFVWDVAGTLEPRSRRLSKDELQRCWTALAGEDAEKAFQAIRRLAAAPEQTVPFLREHLKPVPASNLKHIRHLVDLLDSADFPTRQKAAEELEKQADSAVGLMRQIVAKEKPSLEVRRRLQQILDAQENKPESLRAIRAVEVLEWIAAPDAVRLVDELAKGAADARLTREAVAARNRLRK